MVDAAAKTNSVTISEGIKLEAFLSNSFWRAPSRDYIKNILARVPAGRKVVIYFSIRSPIVNIWFQAAMITQIQLVIKVINCITAGMYSAGGG